MANRKKISLGTDKTPNPSGRGRSPAADVSRLGVLFALSVALSALEGLFPLPLPIPGVRLGLSNIVVMYCIFTVGAGQGYALSVVKSGFVLITRGAVAAFISLCGGLLSVTVMLILCRGFKDSRYTLSSVGGAIAHNMGQLACAWLLLGSGLALLPFIPLLAVSGVVVGILTAMLLRTTILAVNRTG